ncbi:MAG: hypothetical protein HeimC2_27260 [Candidatus Heimdallarchaeota archaeon LC_2]|nr:MAG: hypothetical protein HeimC2_31850 [Candidatus Heimdallarchaeota archaeon LC_2]OLS21896.1 MAG: hypothetical protein HeimC2_31880 [Candidatus Heimdallarchaeota archaeon LC_2]OLS23173.1 MAG: hypothetical protein HeimC2_27260 [Candidatus Heimdallarchaeota archaeon LC_2]
MFDTSSEKVVTILGGLGVLFVGSAAWLIDKPSIDNNEIIALVNIFNHFILIVIALPFMLKTLFEQETTSKAYILLLNIFSLLNAFFLILIAFQLPSNQLFFNQINDFFIFLLMALGEVIPIYLTVYQRRNNALTLI